MVQGKLGTKSQAISDYMSVNPESSPSQIVEALKQKGIEVSFGLASKVKYGQRKKTSAKKEVRTVAAKSSPAVTGSESIRQFIAENPTAMSKDVVTALHGQGIEVSVSLVDKVKSRSRGKRVTRRRKSASINAAYSQKGAVSKSESIRNFLRQNPGATPKVVRAGLWKEGVRVGTGLISNVAFYFRKKNTAPSVKVAARRMPAKTSRKTASTGMTVEQLLSVKQFVDTCGGADQVRQALDMLEQLR